MTDAKGTVIHEVHAPDARASGMKAPRPEVGQVRGSPCLLSPGPVLGTSSARNGTGPGPAFLALGLVAVGREMRDQGCGREVRGGLGARQVGGEPSQVKA